MHIQHSSGPNGTKNVGLGGGVNLRAANIITADDVHLDGLFWVRFYDVAGGELGAEGQTIATSVGHPFLWTGCADHWESNIGWSRGGGCWAAWGDDEGIPPSPRDWFPLLATSVTLDDPTTFQFTQMETPCLVYDDEDVTYPFKAYAHGVNTSGQGQTTIVYGSDDLTTWTPLKRSHKPSVFDGHAGYHWISKPGAGDWKSRGMAHLSSGQNDRFGYWTSTDGLDFTLDGTHDDLQKFNGTNSVYRTIGGATPEFIISAQRYVLCREEEFSVTISNVSQYAAAQSAGQRTGMYVVYVPVDEFGNVDTSVNSAVRVSSRYAGNYPGPTYLQAPNFSLRNGVGHVNAPHGFFADTGLVSGADYEDGGGYDDELIDYYTFIVDAAAAAQTGPIGVRTRCSAGVVTIEWYDALPNNTYRVYRGTTVGTQATLIGDVNGTSTTNSPGDGTFYYKVVTLEGATERGSKIIRARCGSGSEFVNVHTDKALAAGADASTIDESWLALVEEWLRDEGLFDDLGAWADPAFGTTKDGSNVVSRGELIGKDRWGWLTPTTSSTTYNATGLNSTVPAWVNGASNAFAHFGGGRFNNIRRLHNSGLTLVAAFQKSHSNTVSLFGYGEFGGLALQNLSGSPGTCNAFYGNFGNGASINEAHATTLANSAAHIIGMTVSPTTAFSYVEGVASSGQAIPSTQVLKGQLGTTSNTYLLGVGSKSVKNTAAMTALTGSYTFGDNQAQFSYSDLIVFERALSSAQMLSLNDLLRDRIGA